VAEDDLLIGRLLGDVLDGLGHRTTVVTTEEDAVQQALSQHPDLMIVDVALGSGSGIDAMAKISQQTSIPHIFLTGDPSTVRADCPEAIVLQKPFRQRNLVEAIDRVIAPN
jgi:CheY-like chemotaxis protein